MRMIRVASVLAASFAFLGNWAGTPGPPSDGPRSNSTSPTGFVDCNDNGIDDSVDIGQGTSSDCNGNGIPDECDVVVQVTPLPITTDVTKGFDAGDIDDDGDVDVLGRELWYENIDGLGSFGPGQLSIPEDSKLEGAEVVHLGDMDGDSDLDTLRGFAFGYGFAVAWSRNLDGKGEFGSDTFVFFEGGKGGPGDWFVDFFVADANGDDDNDVFVLGVWEHKGALPQGWYVRLRNNSGTGSFADGGNADEDSTMLCFGGPCPVFARVADLDNDDDPDVLTHWTHIPELRWVENDGSGGFGPPQVIDIGELSGIEIADLDTDQDLDIITASTVLDEIAWYENDGSGNFGARQVLVDTDGTLLVADVDYDGDTDLVSVHDGTLVWYENVDGSGNLAAEQVLSDAPPYDSRLAADLNGDGPPDILGKDSANGLGWYRNDGGDCNHNGIPDDCDPDCNSNSTADECEADCNLNGAADDCDIDDGTSADCDTNNVPDECGPPLPDVDQDGVCDFGDCERTDDQVWAEPQAIEALLLSQNHDEDTTELSWSPPDQPGAVLVRYDLLRSDDSSDFLGPATCLETDDTDTAGADAQTPSSGSLFGYLVRIENDCPGDGNLGVDSSNVPRVGLACD